MKINAVSIVVGTVRMKSVRMKSVRVKRAIVKYGIQEDTYRIKERSKQG